MDINRLVELLRGLPFRQAVWLFLWQMRFTSSKRLPTSPPGQASTRCLATRISAGDGFHGLGMVFAIAFCALASLFPNRFVVFLFFALCLSESVLNSYSTSAQPRSLVFIVRASSQLCLCIRRFIGTSANTRIETAC
jgi:hypothetical protein